MIASARSGRRHAAIFLRAWRILQLHGGTGACLVTFVVEIVHPADAGGLAPLLDAETAVLGLLCMRYFYLLVRYRKMIRPEVVALLGAFCAATYALIQTVSWVRWIEWSVAFASASLFVSLTFGNRWWVVGASAQLGDRSSESERR
jgi:hypothetical protein